MQQTALMEEQQTGLLGGGMREREKEREEERRGVACLCRHAHKARGGRVRLHQRIPFLHPKRVPVGHALQMLHRIFEDESQEREHPFDPETKNKRAVELGTEQVTTADFV